MPGSNKKILRVNALVGEGAGCSLKISFDPNEIKTYGDLIDLIKNNYLLPKSLNLMLVSNSPYKSRRAWLKENELIKVGDVKLLLVASNCRQSKLAEQLRLRQKELRETGKVESPLENTALDHIEDEIQSVAEKLERLLETLIASPEVISSGLLEELVTYKKAFSKQFERPVFVKEKYPLGSNFRPSKKATEKPEDLTLLRNLANMYAWTNNEGVELQKKCQELIHANVSTASLKRLISQLGEPLKKGINAWLSERNEKAPLAATAQAGSGAGAGAGAGVSAEVTESNPELDSLSSMLGADGRLITLPGIESTILFLRYYPGEITEDVLLTIEAERSTISSQYAPLIELARDPNRVTKGMASYQQIGLDVVRLLRVGFLCFVNQVIREKTKPEWTLTECLLNYLDGLEDYAEATQYGVPTRVERLMCLSLALSPGSSKVMLDHLCSTVAFSFVLNNLGKLQRIKERQALIRADLTGFFPDTVKSFGIYEKEVLIEVNLSRLLKEILPAVLGIQSRKKIQFKASRTVTSKPFKERFSSYIIDGCRPPWLGFTLPECEKFKQAVKQTPDRVEPPLEKKKLSKPAIIRSEIEKEMTGALINAAQLEEKLSLIASPLAKSVTNLKGELNIRFLLNNYIYHLRRLRFLEDAKASYQECDHKLVAFGEPLSLLSTQLINHLDKVIKLFKQLINVELRIETNSNQPVRPAAAGAGAGAGAGASAAVHPVDNAVDAFLSNRSAALATLAQPLTELPGLEQTMALLKVTNRWSSIRMSVAAAKRRCLLSRKRRINNQGYRGFRITVADLLIIDAENTCLKKQYSEVVKVIQHNESLHLSMQKSYSKEDILAMGHASLIRLFIEKHSGGSKNAGSCLFSCLRDLAEQDGEKSLQALLEKLKLTTAVDLSVSYHPEKEIPYIFSKSRKRMRASNMEVFFITISFQDSVLNDPNYKKLSRIICKYFPDSSNSPIYLDDYGQCKIKLSLEVFVNKILPVALALDNRAYQFTANEQAAAKAIDPHKHPNMMGC